LETWDAITSRKNVRAFDSRAIAEGDLTRILEAGRRSPSSQNWQPWDFVVVTDREQLQRLSTVWRGGGHIAGAAAAVCMVIDHYPEENIRERAQYDLGQASMSMMVAAADLGIGSGHSSVGEQDLAREILGVPQGKLVSRIIDFGYPAGKPLKPLKKPARRPFDEVVHWGRW
jgi:nitroreductase